MPISSSQHNATYWLRVKHDETRLAHYRARRARNQRARRSRLASAISSGTDDRHEPSDVDLLAMVIETLIRAEPVG